MTTPSTEPAPDTRQRILDAALQVFAAKGYHETKVDEIVAASNTSKGAVYFHFPGKQQLFLALVDEFARLLEKRLDEAIAASQDNVERVSAALQVALETFGRYRPMAKIFLVQAVGLGQAFEEKRMEIHLRFVHIIQRYLEQAVTAGEIPALDAEVAAYAWMGAINEVVIRWVYTGQPEPQRALPTLRAVLLRSIGVPEHRIQQAVYTDN